MLAGSGTWLAMAEEFGVATTAFTWPNELLKTSSSSL